MPEVAAKLKTYRFDQMAVQVKDKIHPDDADVDRYVGLEHIDPESLKIRRWGEPNDVESTKIRFRAGDIIFGKRRAYQRKLAVADFDGICSAHAMVLRPKTDVVLKEFLPFFMQTDTFMERAVKISVGGLSPTINWKDLAKEEFALPPIEEQRRISEMLLAATDAAEKLHSLLVASESCHRALCRWTFSVNSAGRFPQDTELSGGWRLSTLGEVAEFLDGKRVPLKSADRSKRPGPYPYYGASGVIDHIDDFIFDEPLVLVSEDGANLVDRTTPIAFEATGRYWVNNHAHVLRVTPPLTNSYVIEYIESLSLMERISGTAQPKLNKAACEGIPIPIPPDDNIDAVVSILDRSRDSVAELGRRQQAVVALRKQLVEHACGTHEVNE